MSSVGAYDAKTRLPQLLDEVTNGEKITITRHGQPVAMLVPMPGGRKGNVAEVIQALKEFRKGQTLGPLPLRQLVEEGRS